MREIKFRAWNKENEKMIYSNETYPRSIYKFEFDIVSNFNFKLTKMVDRFNVKDDDGENYYIECYEPIDADIMQYTGIKDKNNKEIYEGDIVEFYSNVEDEIITEKVEYHFGIYRAGDYFVGKIYNKCEVIGNIYENPELLV